MDAQRQGDDELHAYVDGQLGGDRRLAVERRLAEDPDAQRACEDYRAQTALLHEIFDPILREPAEPALAELTQRLKGRLAGNDNQRAWHARSWVRMAAAVALVVVGAAGGYLGRGLAPGGVGDDSRALRSFAEEATQAHRFFTADDRHQVEIGADDPGALDSFLSQRLGRSVFGPDLAPVGFRLIGGRSLPTEQGAGAQYMYVNEQGKRVTLFVGTRATGQPTSFSFAQNGDVATFYWVESGLAYALIGRLSKEELLGISKAVFEDVKRGPKATPQSAPAPAPASPRDVPVRDERNPNDQRTENPAGGVQPVADTRKPKDS